jgi:hypothetical protein
MNTQRLNAILLTALSVIVLVLAVVGLYAVISHAIAQRVREIGIRLALGADPSSVSRLVMLEGMKLTTTVCRRRRSARVGEQHAGGSPAVRRATARSCDVCRRRTAASVRRCGGELHPRAAREPRGSDRLVAFRVGRNSVMNGQAPGIILRVLAAIVCASLLPLGGAGGDRMLVLRRDVALHSLAHGIQVSIVGKHSYHRKQGFLLSRVLRFF